jgi:hypothetical protein
MMEDDQHRATKMELLPNKYNINMTVVYTDSSKRCTKAYKDKEVSIHLAREPPS